MASLSLYISVTLTLIWQDIRIAILFVLQLQEVTEAPAIFFNGGGQVCKLMWILQVLQKQAECVSTLSPVVGAVISTKSRQYPHRCVRILCIIQVGCVWRTLLKRNKMLINQHILEFKTEMIEQININGNFNPFLHWGHEWITQTQHGPLHLSHHSSSPRPFDWSGLGYIYSMPDGCFVKMDPMKVHSVIKSQPHCPHPEWQREARHPNHQVVEMCSFYSATSA